MSLSVFLLALAQSTIFTQAFSLGVTKHQCLRQSGHQNGMFQSAPADATIGAMRGFEPIRSSAALLVRNRHEHRRPSKLMVATPLGLAGAAASSTSLVYMALLAVQFGTQPILTQKYAGKDSAIVKRTYVGVQDLTRIAFCLLGLAWSSSSQPASILPAVARYRPALALVMFPAALYALQNYCSLTAYQSLDPITYNVLNQTKTIAAAVWCYFLLRQPQSPQQMAALVLLVVAALVMENQNPFQFLTNRKGGADESSNTAGVVGEGAEESLKRRQRRTGLAAILTASMTSGLAGAWTQRCLQAGQRPCNSLVFSMELSIVSFVLLVASAVLKPSPESKESEESSLSLMRQLFRGWTAKTWIPVVTNALGGILVGLVTKHAGVVPKGFALILGLFLGGVLQNLTLQSRVTPHQWVGGTLAALSLWMHAAFPPHI